jgi:hypothetical protein
MIIIFAKNYQKTIYVLIKKIKARVLRTYLMDFNTAAGVIDTKVPACPATGRMTA